LNKTTCVKQVARQYFSRGIIHPCEFMAVLRDVYPQLIGSKIKLANLSDYSAIECYSRNPIFLRVQIGVYVLSPDHGGHPLNRSMISC
jgi:hypothetical protein